MPGVKASVGVAVLASARSALVEMWVGSWAVLFVVWASGVGLETEATLVSVPVVTVGATSTVSTSERFPPAATPPAWAQLTCWPVVPVGVQVHPTEAEW